MWKKDEKRHPSSYIQACDYHCQSTNRNRGLRLKYHSGHSQRARLVGLIISHDQISGKFVLIDWWQNILRDWWHIRKSIAGSVCVFTFNEPTCILNVTTVFIVFTRTHTRTHTRIHMDTHEQRGTRTDTHMLTRKLNVWHGHVGPTLYRYSNYYDSSI